MARTDISICSRALMNLGASPINTFTDPRDDAQFLKLAYPEIKASIISAYPWECMKKREELTRESATPGGFRYQFVMPTDLVGAPIAAFPENTPYARGINGFEVRGRRIVTNHEALFIDYTADKPEEAWPAWFAELVMSAICAEIAFMVTDQQSVKDHWETKTYGTPSENRVGGLMGQAQTIDAQGSGNNPGLADDAFVAARFGAVYPGEGWL